MKASGLFIVLAVVALSDMNASGQRSICFTFDSKESTAGISPYYNNRWQLSNEALPPFDIPTNDDGYYWTNYNTNDYYSPRLTFPNIRKVNADTTFSFQYYLSQSSSMVSVSFQVTAPSYSVSKVASTYAVDASSTWLTLSGSCEHCCGIYSDICEGQLIIEATEMANDSIFAIASLSINNDSCQLPQSTPCYTFENWGRWNNTQNWKLSGEELLPPTFGYLDGGYIWASTVNSSTSTNLTTPVVIGVTRSTKLQLDFYILDEEDFITVYFLKKNISAIPQKILSLTNDEVNTWQHHSMDCHIALGVYCCGTFVSERCDGYFLFEITSKKDSFLALDNIGVNRESCGPDGKFIVLPD